MRTARSRVRSLVWCGAALAVLAAAGCPRQGLSSAAMGLDPVAAGRADADAIRREAARRPAAEIPVPAELAANGPIDRLGITVHGDAVVRSDPLESGQPISQLEPGDYVPILRARDGYAGVRMADGATGWVHGSRLRVLDLPATPPVVETDTPGDRIVARATGYLGVPYVWGGTTGAGLDCSGLVQKVFGEESVSLPRVACDQARVGLPIPLGALEAGDRVYFEAGHEIDHTGIYMGDGRFIHASGSGGAVRIDDLMSARWQSIYAGARR